MSMTFAAFLSSADFIIDCKLPVLLRARHGVGKSSVVYQIAKRRNLPVVERRASQMTEGDILGLPKLNGDITRWCPPEWLYKACTEPVCLFIDEIDRAVTEVRQGFFELLDSRKIAGWNLHPETIIFAAINGGEHASQYQVGEMDPAELDRWSVADLEPSVEDWLNWGKDNVEETIWDFISKQPSFLEHNSDFEPNKVYPSRRSWHRFSDVCRKGKLVEPSNPTPVLHNVCTMILGFEVAIAFCDFVKTLKSMVLPADIFDKCEIARTAKFGINDHSSLIDKMIVEEWFKKALTDKQIANLIEYFVSLPSEVAVKLWTDMANSENVDNAVKFASNERANKHLVNCLNPEAAEQNKAAEAAQVAQVAAAPSASVNPAPKKRGRPKGSKNRK
jgi:hypothetical protein